MRFSKNLFPWFFRQQLRIKKQDVTIIVLCIIAAATFWFFIAMNKHYNTAHITYPIHVKYDKNVFIRIAELPTKIKLNVSGQGWDLLKKTFWFNIKPIVLKPANLPKNTYLTSSFLMSIASGYFKNIKINYIMNDTIHLYFDYRVKKTIPVRIDSAGISLVKNFRIISPISFDPDSVEFDGPAASINSLPDIIKLNIPDKYKNIKKDFKKELPIQYKFNKLISLSTKEVQVSFNVALFVQENIIANLKLINLPEGSFAWIEDDTTSISYFINEINKEKTTETDFEIVVDYSTLDLTDSTIRTTVLKKPNYITDLTIDPQIVKIRFNIK